MKQNPLWAALAAMTVAAPAHALGVTEEIVYDATVPADSPGPDAQTRSCSASGLVSASKSCSHGAYYVAEPSLHIVYTVPLLGSGSAEVNLQERTPVVGDYVTFYDRACSTLLNLGSGTVHCIGGQLRDWHYNNYHKFRGSVNFLCGSALHCHASVEARYR